MAPKQKTEPQEIELVSGSPLMFRFAEWFHEHGQKVVYGGVAALLLLVIALTWSQQRKGASERSYVDAEISYGNFFKLAAEQTDPAKEQPFTTLKKAIEDHPELGARYDGPVTQVFLRVGSMESALVYGDSALKRLSRENFPAFEEFSKTSLLIAQGNDQEALKRALFLQKKMTETPSKDALVLLNQLRIAMLYGRLGQKQDEMKAWSQWDQLVTANPQAAQQIADGFQTGRVTLADYIAARKKDLS